VGKGDKRTRRGKLWRGTYGKRRPRKKKQKLQQQAAVTPPSEQASFAEDPAA
jgi:30S ribosomal protein S31